MLEKYFAADSKVDLRVLVLTDGQNNAGVSPEVAFEAVNRIGAVVDVPWTVRKLQNSQESFLRSMKKHKSQ